MLLKIQGRETADIEGSSSHSDGYVFAKDGLQIEKKKFVAEIEN